MDDVSFVGGFVEGFVWGFEAAVVGMWDTVYQGAQNLIQEFT